MSNLTMNNFTYVNVLVIEVVVIMLREEKNQCIIELKHVSF